MTEEKADGERNSFKNEKTDRHLLMSSIDEDHMLYENDIVEYNNNYWCIRLIKHQIKLISITTKATESDIIYFDELAKSDFSFNIIGNLYESLLLDSIPYNSRTDIYYNLILTSGEKEELDELIHTRTKFIDKISKGMEVDLDKDYRCPKCGVALSFSKYCINSDEYTAKCCGVTYTIENKLILTKIKDVTECASAVPKNLS